MPITKESKDQIKIAKLKRALLSVVDESLTVKDLMKNFKKIVAFIKRETDKLKLQIDDKTSSAVKDLEATKKEFDKVIAEAKQEGDSSLSGFKARTLEAINSIFDKNRVNQKLTQKLIEVDKKLAEVRDGLDGLDGISGIDGRDGIDADVVEVAIRASKLVQDELKPVIPTIRTIKKSIPKMGRVIRKAIKNKIKISDVKGLRKELDKRGKTVFTGASGGASGGGHVLAYDLSGSLDTSTRTFSIPAFWKIISIQLSSFPNTLRPTTDYTSDASAMTITFTSEVPINSLATGQTCIIVYAEP